MKSLFRDRMRRQRPQRSMALVIVLAFVVLLSVLVLAFLSRALISRQLSKSSAGQAKAEMLARSAADIIVSDLKQEIANGSANYTTSGYTIYRQTNAAYMMPQTNISAAAYAAIPNLIRESLRSDPIVSPGISSLASAVSSTDVSQNGRSVTAVRWNLHYLIPRLNAGSTSVDTTPIASFSAPDWVIVTRSGPQAFTTWNTSLADSSSANTNYAVGRYAFAVYNEGGLLDMNAAGSPTGLTANQIGLKGALPLSDLTQLPVSPAVTQTNIDQIVGWRNNATAKGLTGSFPNFTFSAASAGNWFTNFVSNNTNGFTTVVQTTNNPTDQAFLSRQQLIQMVNTLGISQDALQYMGTFTRVLNAPTWEPTKNASDPSLGGNNSGLSTNTFSIPPYGYLSNAEIATISNPLYPTPPWTSSTESNPNLDVLAVRVVHSFPVARADGTFPVVGEPLVKNRFPLSRLAGITYTGTPPTGNTTMINGVMSPATAATIQRDFGLIWNSVSGTSPAGYYSAHPGYPGYWTYVGGYVGATSSNVQSAIKTLNEVANDWQAGTTTHDPNDTYREPNFFELLKAGILSGSLGKQGYSQASAIDPDTTDSAYTPGGQDGEPDNQIIQIGANIIDQSDADSYPTAIAFSTYIPNTSEYQTATFFGNENLPGLANVFFDAYRYKNQTTPVAMYGTNYATPIVGMWLKPIVWNPYANALQVQNPNGGPSDGGGTHPAFRFVANGSVTPVLSNGGNSYYNAIPNTNNGATGQSPYTPSPTVGTTLPNYTTEQAFAYKNSTNQAPTILSDTNADGTQGSIGFDYPNHNGFSEPSNLSSYKNGTTLSSGGIIATGKDNQKSISFSAGSVGFFGIWIGDVFAPDLLQNSRAYPMLNATQPNPDPNDALAPVNEWNYAGLDSPAGLSYELQYWNGNNWQGYDAFRQVIGANGLSDNYRLAGGPGYPGNSTYNCYQMPRMVMENLRSDPRTDRFGCMCTYNLPAPGADFYSPNYVTPQQYFQGIRIGTTYNATNYSGNYSDWLMAFNGPVAMTNSASVFMPLPPGWTYQSPAFLAGSPFRAAWLGVLSDNLTNSITSYTDPDGVMRPGDSAYANPNAAANPDAGYPLIAATNYANVNYAGNTFSRPVMLDRPFRSVGELGFVSRGMPWKTLDFFTRYSADAGLLDLFSVSEAPAIIAGTINLNTRQAPVLQAAMAGALKDVADGAYPVSTNNSPSELYSLATNITTITGTNLLQNRSDLATIISPALNYTSSVNTDNAIKARREAVVRALSSFGDTRTWNLLIDVVAQAGRYPPTANQLSQFVAEGERHYWLHVAIDRYTGQVVSQSMELVNE